MIRAVFFDLQALLYGPTTVEMLTDILRNENIEVTEEEVADALARLPQEVHDIKANMRTEEQEDEYQRVLIPTLLTNLGVKHPTDALIFRLVETVHEYPAYYSMFPEVLAVLEELKQRGLKLAVIANWDPSLGRLLKDFELADYFDAVLSSTEAGLRKPDPFMFQKTAKLLGLDPADVIHVGPSLREDVPGAMSAGMVPVWLNRTGIPTGHDVLAITDLRGVLMITQPEH